MANKHTETICSCGNPQSFPIPHEHDQTDREKQIVKHYESKLNNHDKLANALQGIRKLLPTELKIQEPSFGYGTFIREKDVQLYLNEIDKVIAKGLEK